MSEPGNLVEEWGEVAMVQRVVQLTGVEAETLKADKAKGMCQDGSGGPKTVKRKRVNLCFPFRLASLSLSKWFSLISIAGVLCIIVGRQGYALTGRQMPLCPFQREDTACT